MSRKLIKDSQDYMSLKNEGYSVDVVGTYMLVKNVPYINNLGDISYGTLVSNVSIGNNAVMSPDTHVIYWIGEFPCNKDCSKIVQLQHQGEKNLGHELNANYSFSFKRTGTNGYESYYDKFKVYFGTIAAPAISLNPDLKYKNLEVYSIEESESVHHYDDTNSSRSYIDAINQKLSGLKVAIIGLGGTGSFVLDSLAKTQIQEIHLFDNDDFLQHNAFRAPGAPSIVALKESIKKVEYFENIYSRMHKGIKSHVCILQASNVYKLKDMDFVFVCIDDPEAKVEIFDFLWQEEISFIDTGMGILRSGDSLRGLIRTTFSTPDKNDHVHKRVSFIKEVENDYKTNIQIAELNSLTAAIAVIKFKKFYGFYTDKTNEHNSVFNIDSNSLANDEIET